MSSNINGQSLVKSYDAATSRFDGMRDKEMMKETSWGIGPLHIPKKLGPINFINEDNVNRIQEKYQKMEEIVGQIMQQIAEAMKRQSSAGQAQN